MSPLKPEYARGRQSRTKPATLAEVHAAADKLEARHRRIHDRIVGRATRYRGGSDFATPEPNEGGPS